MFDTIGEDYWTGGGVTAKKVAAQLKVLSGPVEVQINSPGGDMFEGFAIYNLLREHPHAVTIKIMGMAASAASIIAMAGDKVEIAASSFIMIHNCWVLAGGNRNELRDVADWLEPFDRSMCEVYSERTGKDVKTIAKMLDSETWLSGSQAVADGFADAILAAGKTVVDDTTKAHDRHVNDLRGMERSLISAGMGRDAARAQIDRVRARGAGPAAGSDDTAMSGLLGDLISAMRC